MRVWNLAMVSGLLLSVNCFATPVVDRDVRLLLKESKAVLEGEVVRIKSECMKSRCSSEITIAVEKRYKGNPEAGEARFCSFAPVIVGFRYVFFVEAAAENQAGRSQCDGVVERDAVFSRFGDAVYRYMSPGSFNTAKIHADEYLTGWILVRGFDEALREQISR